MQRPLMEVREGRPVCGRPHAAKRLLELPAMMVGRGARWLELAEGTESNEYIYVYNYV